MDGTQPSAGTAENGAHLDGKLLGELATQLQNDFRSLQRESHIMLGAGVALATLCTPLVGVAPDVGFPALLALLSFACGWYLNINAESAAVAVHRNYVSRKANAALGDQVYRYEDIGKVGESHPATMLVGAIPAVLLFGIFAAGVANALHGITWPDEALALPDAATWILLLVTFGYCLVALLGATYANSTYRENSRISLFGEAPGRTYPSVPSRIWKSIVDRDRQGYLEPTEASPTAPTNPSAQLQAPEPQE